MELIVISSPTAIVNEAKIINQLFEAGMSLFHLRKPDWNDHQSLKLLENINPAFHEHIALHQHHNLVKKTSIKRLHFKEKLRSAITEAEISTSKEEGITWSTSVHQLSDLLLSTIFDYVFFSPVFDSISKLGYESKLAKDFVLEKTAVAPAVIALGGINEQNIGRIAEMKFDGAGVLGAIWQEPAQAVASFRRLNDLIKN